MHVTTTTDDWVLESIRPSETVSTPSKLAEADSSPEQAVASVLPSSPQFASTLGSDLRRTHLPVDLSIDSKQKIYFFCSADAHVVLDSLVPILNKIQSSLNIEENEYHIVNEVEVSEWRNLQEHARDVVEMTISDTAHPKISASIFFRLGQLQGAETPLFPMLQKLHIINTTTSPIPYLDLFFTPSLEALSIKGIANPSKMTVASFLKKVGTHSQIHNLILDSINMSPEIFVAINQCRHLTSLELANLTWTLDYTSLGIVGLLPHLETFSIDTKGVTQIHPLATAFPAAPKYLHIQSFSFVRNFSTLEGIISDLVDAPLLRKIHLEVIKYDPAATKGGKKSLAGTPVPFPLKELIERIAGNQTRQEYMTDFTFNVNQNSNLTSLPSDIIDSLARLHKLASLEILGIIIADLDKALSAMGDQLSISVWPKLRTLRFHVPETTVNSKIAHGISLASLQRIARACPDLRVFQGVIVLPTAPLPSWSVPTNTPESGTPVMNHGLKTLILGSAGTSQTQLNLMTTSTLSLAHYVAKYLYAIFPNIELEEDGRQIGKLHASFWMQVYDCMKLCRDAREIDQRREKLALP